MALEAGQEKLTAEIRRDLSDNTLDLAHELHIGHLLRRAYQQARKNISALLEGFEVTPMQVAALVAVARKEAVSQAELGRLIGMEPPNVHGLVLRLKKTGLIEVTTHPQISRQVVVRLTARGRELVGRLPPIKAKATEKTLAHFTPDEREQLIQMLQRIS